MAFSHPTLPTSREHPRTRRELPRTRRPRRTNTPTCRATPTIIVPGKFDALHLGHRHLHNLAREHGNPTLLTFSNMQPLLKWIPRPPIVAEIHRRDILSDWGNPTWRILPFESIRHMSPVEFISHIKENLECAGIVCGQDWRFGKGACAGVEELREIGGELGVGVWICDELLLDGEVVSSTRVRTALKEGDVALVARLLGRPHRAVGSVVSVVPGYVICAGFVNQTPGQGKYIGTVRVVGRAAPFRTTVEVIDQDVVHVKEEEGVYCEECEIYIDFLERL